MKRDYEENISYNWQCASIKNFPREPQIYFRSQSKTCAFIYLTAVFMYVCQEEIFRSSMIVRMFASSFVHMVIWFNGIYSYIYLHLFLKKDRIAFIPSAT